MTRSRLIATAVLVSMAAYLLAWPVAIDPTAWAPAPNPGLTGPFAHRKGFTALQPVAPDVGDGPEAVTPGPDGFLYTGLQDGWLVRFRADGQGSAERVVHTGGRPLGMQFDARGHLVVADAFRGLLSVAPDRTITPLVEAVDGRRLLFPNALAIAADGAVWFSDASQRVDQHHWRLDFWEGRATGRLLRYDPQTHQTAVWLKDLRFANGVALGPEDAFVLVNETLAARVHRLWLAGPRAGTHEVFLDGLPGSPDNLSYNGRGLFWGALPAPRIHALDRLAGSPWLRPGLFRLPAALTEVQPQAVAWVLGVDVQGTVRHQLRDTSGWYANVTSVAEADGVLWLGSLFGHRVGRADPGRAVSGASPSAQARERARGQGGHHGDRDWRRPARWARLWVRGPSVVGRRRWIADGTVCGGLRTPA
jgi:sugar lactone lactonase YvrE